MDHGAGDDGHGDTADHALAPPGRVARQRLEPLGVDHRRLTFYHNGIERRLTNVHGHVINDLFA